MADRRCSRPGCTNHGIHLCSGCGEESYCSKECQKDHWIDHKIQCKLGNKNSYTYIIYILIFIIILATKPETAAILQSFDNLSIKQLRNLVIAKSASMEPKKKINVLNQLDNLQERSQILWLVKQHIQPVEIEVLLTNSNIVIQQVSNQDNNTRNKHSKKKIINQVSSNQPNTTSNQTMGTPNPEQMKQQAAFMKKNPDAVRKSNTMFAKMTNQQIIEYANQIEKVI